MNQPKHIIRLSPALARSGNNLYRVIRLEIFAENGTVMEVTEYADGWALHERLEELGYGRDA